LLGLGIIYDIYVSGIVNWTFWKKRNGKNSAFVEWMDALIFAVIAVTLINIFLFQNYRIPTGSMEKSLLIGDHLFVSKLAYGPRMPNTPIAFPFTQNTMPLTKGKSWSDLITWPYKRLAGLGKLKNNDAIVFNFPAGDTVVLERTETAYYEIVRETAREMAQRVSYGNPNPKPSYYYMNAARKELWERFTIIYSPVYRRDNYVKRCIGILRFPVIKGGSVLQQCLFRNKTHQLNYVVATNCTTINHKVFELLWIYKSDQQMDSCSAYLLPLTKSNAEAISKFANVKEVAPLFSRAGEYAAYSRTVKVSDGTKITLVQSGFRSKALLQSLILPIFAFTSV
jgi:signal peptidase I